MQQSIKAQDRSLGDWYNAIENGRVKLPRFQRYEAWDKRRIQSLFDTALNNLPIGVALILQVEGSTEPFVSRYISHAEPKHPEPVTQHLLDGQQRLTAFWRALHNSYEWDTYFAYIAEFDQSADEEVETQFSCRVVGRWQQKGNDRLYPLWANSARDSLSRGLVPLSLLKPINTIQGEVDQWLNDAIGEEKPDISVYLADGAEPAEAIERFKADEEAFSRKEKRLREVITQLRERLTHYNMPYLALPVSTPKDVALQVFINMNTNSKPLSIYDIIVAEVESVKEKSLHDAQTELLAKYPDVEHYQDAGWLMLTTAALLQDKTPNQRGALDMCKETMVAHWDKIELGLGRMAAFLAGQGVFDEQRLPTNAVLAVIAACLAEAPETGDRLGFIKGVLSRYMWRAFFTSRYENSTASRAFADYKVIRQVCADGFSAESRLKEAPVFTEEMVTKEQLLVEGWPKKAGSLRRGILALTTRLGALDFADNEKASYDSLQKRHYHHIFPDALLQEAGLDENQSYLALNCSLISGCTNMRIGRKDPWAYLEERVGHVNRDMAEYRLKTHLIDPKMLIEATYEGLSCEEFATKVAQDYAAFLENRVALVMAAAKALCEGKEISVEGLFTATSDAEEN
ncbi:DUF262 domain-containing protein [Shewanella algae]|uniref:DUF262 domain-containing protein n=1 Tax=Shewanella algae TaxID=38313 RepID=UPI001BF02B69|nr:DUF262 domain-containing protein [Shewanella algae]BCV53705.1 hypothetical protein TUM17383_19520 [Shewanella algae]